MIRDGAGHVHVRCIKLTMEYWYQVNRGGQYRVSRRHRMPQELARHMIVVQAEFVGSRERRTTGELLARSHHLLMQAFREDCAAVNR